MNKVLQIYGKHWRFWAQKSVPDHFAFMNSVELTKRHARVQSRLDGSPFWRL